MSDVEHEPGDAFVRGCVDRAVKGETVRIMRRGECVAVVIDYPRWERLCEAVRRASVGAAGGAETGGNR